MLDFFISLKLEAGRLGTKANTQIAIEFCHRADEKFKFVTVSPAERSRTTQTIIIPWILECFSRGAKRTLSCVRIVEIISKVVAFCDVGNSIDLFCYTDCFIALIWLHILVGERIVVGLAI